MSADQKLLEGKMYTAILKKDVRAVRECLAQGCHPLTVPYSCGLTLTFLNQVFEPTLNADNPDPKHIEITNLLLDALDGPIPGNLLHFSRSKYEHRMDSDIELKVSRIRQRVQVSALYWSIKDMVRDRGGPVPLPPEPVSFEENGNAYWDENLYAPTAPVYTEEGLADWNEDRFYIPNSFLEAMRQMAADPRQYRNFLQDETLWNNAEERYAWAKLAGKEMPPSIHRGPHKDAAGTYLAKYLSGDSSSRGLE